MCSNQSQHHLTLQLVFFFCVYHEFLMSPTVTVNNEFHYCPSGKETTFTLLVCCGGVFVISDASGSSSNQWSKSLLDRERTLRRSPLSQAYSTVTSDNARFNERVAEIRARPKTPWVPKPWPPKSEYTSHFPKRSRTTPGHFLYARCFGKVSKKPEHIFLS